MAIKPVPAIRSPLFRQVFAQVYRLRIYGSEATITFSNFGDVPSEPGEPGDPVVVEEVAIMGNFAMMKALALELTKMVATIESAHGEIPLDPAALQNIENIVNVVRTVHRPKGEN